MVNAERYEWEEEEDRVRENSARRVDGAGWRRGNSFYVVRTFRVAESIITIDSAKYLFRCGRCFLVLYDLNLVECEVQSCRLLLY